MDPQEKQEIEQAIARARDGVGERIDELDQRLRSTLDVKNAARQHAPKLIAGGAMIGFLVGFGFPRPLWKLVKIGVPLALITLAVKRARGNGA